MGSLLGREGVKKGGDNRNQQDEDGVKSWNSSDGVCGDRLTESWKWRRPWLEREILSQRFWRWSSPWWWAEGVAEVVWGWINRAVISFERSETMRGPHDASCITVYVFQVEITTVYGGKCHSFQWQQGLWDSKPHWWGGMEVDEGIEYIEMWGKKLIMIRGCWLIFQFGEKT